MTTNTERRILAVMPLAWGKEALAMILGALQSQASVSGAKVQLMLLSDIRYDDVAEMVREAGIELLLWVLHADLSEGIDNKRVSLLATEALSEQISKEQQTLVLLPPGIQGEELSASLAQQLGAKFLGRCGSLEWCIGGFSIIRSAWGGRVNQKIICNTSLAVASYRGDKVQACSNDVLEQQELVLDMVLPGLARIESESTGEKLLPIEGAKLVVSGGRGVNDEGFKLLEQLAHELDASLGGSLPAVDAGCVPVMRQVGISGKFVTADAYLAVGISGTPQHMAGISPETRIFAVNKDANADIFQFAEAGCVADWEQFLPVLLSALKDST